MHPHIKKPGKPYHENNQNQTIWNQKQKHRCCQRKPYSGNKKQRFPWRSQSWRFSFLLKKMSCRKEARQLCGELLQAVALVFNDNTGLSPCQLYVNTKSDGFLGFLIVPRKPAAPLCAKKDRQQLLPVLLLLFTAAWRKTDPWRTFPCNQYSTSPVNTSLASPVNVTCSSV